MKESAVYIHVPFCVQRCHYCDFFSTLKKNHTDILDAKDGSSVFTRKVIADLEYQKNLYNIDEFTSVFIGGGTPSLLTPQDIFFLANSISKMHSRKNIEFSIEMNPESITEDFIKSAIDGGVNRFSVGIQTFNYQILKEQNRIGSPEITRRALELLQTLSQKYDFQFSCDLISGFEGQTADIITADIKTLLEFAPPHISLYSLCTHDSRQDAENDTSAELWKDGFKMLKQAGYIRYEISNFALSPETECIHNKVYWTMQNYLGIAPSAVGTIVHEHNDKPATAIRRECIADIHKWLNSPDDTAYTTEKIDTHTLIEETLMMGFRLTGGINLADFEKRFHRPLYGLLKNTIEKWQSKKLLELSDTACRLNENGLLFLNQFLVDTFIELDSKLN